MRFANSTNWLLGALTAAGIVIGVASGAAICALAAFTPVVTSVPIRMPIESVNSSRLIVRSFWCRILSKKPINRKRPFYRL